MGDEAEKRLEGIFRIHNERVAERDRRAEEDRKRRAAAAERMYAHLSGTVVPELRRLAAMIQRHGQKATVDESPALETGEGLRGNVKLSIVPHGHESAQAGEIPVISFHTTFGGIGSQLHAMFPGKGGQSSAGEYFSDPAELTAEKVQALVISLIEKTFVR
jgi:hypothetical protein